MTTIAQLLGLFKFILIYSLQSLFVLFIIRFFYITTLIADQILLSALLVALIHILYTYFQSLRSKTEIPFQTILYLVCAFMFFLTFSIQVIVNTERSRSFYILEWVECAPQEASIEVIENEYKIKYQTEDLKEFKLRLSEHITRGVITIYPKPELTWFGKLLYITSTFLAKVFKLNGWKANKIWSKCD